MLALKQTTSQNCRRLFSTTATRLSNVGTAPIILPEGVKIKVEQKELDPLTKLRQSLASKRGGKPQINLTREVTVSGPNGELKVDVASFVRVKIDNNKMRVEVRDQEAKHQRSMWGTTRTLLNNSVSGVTEGHLSIIKFVGTGYRATVEEKNGRQVLSMRVGYCVPIVINVPHDLRVEVPLPHRIIIKGCDKQKVKQLAATIRKHRPPEPYKGKGIFVDNETITLKQRKIK